MLSSSLFEKFKVEHSEELSEIFTYFVFSGQYRTSPYNDKSLSEIVVDELAKKVVGCINTAQALPEEYALQDLAPYFTPKRPTKEHFEAVQRSKTGKETLKGFDKLINDLMN